MAPTVPMERSPISLDVQGGTSSVGPAGAATGQALAGLGQMAANIGFDIAGEIHKSEAISESSKASLQARYDARDYAAKLNTKYPTGYITDEAGNKILDKSTDTYRTITNEYKDWSEKRFQEDQEKLGSKLAKEMYRQSAMPHLYEALDRVSLDEAIAKTNAFTSELNQSLELGRNRQVQTPDPAEAYQLQQSLITQLEAQRKVLRMDNSTYMMLRNAIMHKTPESVLDGYMALARSNPKKGDGSSIRLEYIERGLELLNGQDEASKAKRNNKILTFSETMDPDKKSAFLNQFEDMKQSAVKLDASDWRRTTHNLSISADSKEGIDPLKLDAFIREGVFLNNKNQVSDQEFLDSVTSILATAELKKVFESTDFLLAAPDKKETLVENSIEQIQKRVLMHAKPEDREKFKLAGIATRERLRNESAKIAETVQRKFEKNPVEFAMFHRGIRDAWAQLNFANPLELENPAKARMFNEASNQLDNVTQSYNGQLPSTYLTESASSALATMLKGDRPASITTNDISRMLKALHNADPRRYIGTMETLIDKHNLDKSWLLALRINRPDLAPLADQWIEAIVNQGKYVNADAILKNQSTTITEVKGALEQKVAPYIANLLQKTSSPLTQLEHERVIDTMFNMTMKKINSGMTPSQAITETADQLPKNFNDDIYIGNQVSKVLGYSLSGTTQKTALSPYLFGRKLTTVEKQNIAENLTYVKAHIADTSPDVPNGLPKEIEDKWTSDFLKDYDNTQLHYDERSNAYYIKWKDSRLGEWHWLTKNKVPIKIPVENLIKPPKPYGAPAEAKQFLNNLYDKIRSKF